jgi:DNA protecting protein DprA
MEKTELVLGLVRCPFLSCAEREYLAKILDNLESLTVLSIEDICLKVGRNIRTRCWQPKKLADQVCRDMEIIQQFGIRFVPVMDPDYPPLLRELYDPPFAVFWRGTLPDPEQVLVGIVGTRTPSGDGALAAARLGREFAESGVPVVSGLARGIDAFAHRGNLDGGAPTVAVLACGVEQIYPRSNICLARRIIESGGCVMGEYPPGDEPLQYRFPQRNRIISGLSRAVLVVEAPEKSGALITADFALEQGRDLYVFRGALASRRGEGTRRLAEEGAQAIVSAGEILSSWGMPLRSTPAVPGGTAGAPGEKLSHTEAVGRQLALDFRKEMALRYRKGC